jgi:hypothetical protein
MGSSLLPKYSHLLLLYGVSFVILLFFGAGNLLAVKWGYTGTNVLFLLAGVGTALFAWRFLERSISAKNLAIFSQTATAPIVFEVSEIYPSGAEEDPRAAVNEVATPDVLLFTGKNIWHQQLS